MSYYVHIIIKMPIRVIIDIAVIIIVKINSFLKMILLVLNDLDIF